jgi:hypothetical protein
LWGVGCLADGSAAKAVVGALLVQVELAVAIAVPVTEVAAREIGGCGGRNWCILATVSQMPGSAATSIDAASS